MKLERLVDVIVGTTTDGTSGDVFAGVAGNNDGFYRGLDPANFSEALHPVHRAQAHVGEDQPKLVGGRRQNGLFRVGGDHHLVLLFFEHRSQHTPKIGVVFYQQYTCTRHGCLLCSARGKSLSGRALLRLLFGGFLERDHADQLATRDHQIGVVVVRIMFDTKGPGPGNPACVACDRRKATSGCRPRVNTPVPSTLLTRRRPPSSVR